MLTGRRCGGTPAISSPVQQDAAFARPLETGEHPQQRGLAAARWAEQREEFAFEDVQRQPLDGDEIAEALAHRLEPHQRLGGQTPVAWIALRHADTLNAPDERLNQPVSIGDGQCVQFTAAASSRGSLPFESFTTTSRRGSGP